MSWHFWVFDVLALISYPIGKNVKVFYNPQDLKVAVLEPGVSMSSYLFLGFGILFTLMGLFFLVKFVRT
jgi:uncharacterized protein DUF3592